MKTLLTFAGALICATPAFAADAPVYKAGVATTVITPAGAVWMAGYASRTKPADGKIHDLYAKALCLEDSAGKRLVLVTTDLIGIPRELGSPARRRNTLLVKQFECHSDNGPAATSLETKKCSRVVDAEFVAAIFID